MDIGEKIERPDCLPTSGPDCPSSHRAEIDSLWVNCRQLAGRVRYLEKLADIYESPGWKRLLFVLDGWPAHRVVSRPAWRPWRRWFTS
jgi:hypothetical protein